jgi:Family of unknown function (DUF6988)
LLCAYVATALEHHEAITLLIKSNMVGSAFVLVRPVHETMVRAFWINKVADQTQIEKASRDELRFPCMSQMLADIEQSYFGIDQSESVAKFFQALNAPWHAMCSYAHSGARQIARRFTNDELKPSYNEGEILEVLNAAITEVMLLILMFFVSMEHYPEADETKKMILEYARAVGGVTADQSVNAAT